MMNPLIAPCYKCERRTDRCHTGCADYEAYRQVRADYNRKLKEWKSGVQYYERSIKDMHYKLTIAK
ncbi:MAG: hypothetical protein ACI4SF_10940 [Oscillospiraceae bacterium]